MAPSETTTQDKQSFARRDLLLSIQAASQKRWEENEVFEVNAPEEGESVGEQGKYFGTFPYPYMNGLLHLGHAFTISKLEFACAYQRLCRKRVLFPQGFHCTGMPIKACADKLNREIELYGNPPVFPIVPDDGEEEARQASEQPEQQQQNNGQKLDPTQFKAKKSKASAKKGAGSQWAILEKSGIPSEEIAQFRDPEHWLKYFPPLAVRDLKAMGCGVDWRRSFITTDANPYYDSFVRWQFWTLYNKGLIIEDKRYTVYSPLDSQPCADHDRASGEGVGPQEYTLIKMEVIELNGILEELEGKGKVFFMAATLRAETMYGQTNCWVLPEGEYGAYMGLNNEIYIMAERSALNLSFQEKTPLKGQPQCVLSISGHELIGTPLKSPHCTYDRIYALPMLNILMNKGTGVVTSVPSDAPDDYITLQDLKNKPKLREKYGVEDEWVLPFEVVPIINIPEFGDKSAEVVCTELKIQSQNDKDKLAEAKQRTYLKGFTDGVMLVGPYKGQKVSDAKPIIRDEMIANGSAMVYSEPEKTVMSRSGDECVVALTDQWYLLYGEEDWLKATEECLKGMEMYASETRHSFEHALCWMKQWACSRSFGLGTWLPWDPKYLIESLSDSTIYMAYYTVAHLLQRGDMYGESRTATLDIQNVVQPEDMCHEVWDYIFFGGDIPEISKVPKDMLEKMRREFEYWYPFDLRVSGKDLIQNHLTFCLYNHTAMWMNDKWPKSFRCNGHLLLNGEKMSKQTGNFLTLQQSIDLYSADAMRMGLADAGDGLEDANFEYEKVNAVILRLTKELNFIEEVVNTGAMRSGGSWTFMDRVFNNEINVAVHLTRKAYDSMLYQNALKCGCYDLQKARDVYRFACGSEGMNRDLLMRYIEVSTLILTPICPHMCDHVWVNILKHEGSALSAGWPQANEPDYVVRQAAEFLEDVKQDLRAKIQKAEAPPKKKKEDTPPPPKITHMDIVIAARYGGWQEAVLRGLAKEYDPDNNSFTNNWGLSALEAVKSDLAVSKEMRSLPDKTLKSKIMPFAKYKQERTLQGGKSVLNVELPFKQNEVLNENKTYLLRSLGLENLRVFCLGDGQEQIPEGLQIEDAYPGKPFVKLYSQ